MEIILAAAAGFCFGVERAVKQVNESCRNGKVYTYGSITHNKTVLADLKQKGVEIIEDFKNITDGTVIIRAHGVPKKVYAELEAQNISYIDCTCPDVKKIHRIVSEEYSLGRKIIIAGSKDHPEVIGVNGWCENSAFIIGEPDETELVPFDCSEKYALVAQTTYVPEKLEKIISNIKKINLDINIYSTICSATRKRQEEAAEISRNVDHMIILGDTSSSNSRKLLEICKKNCKNSYLIESIRDLQLNIFHANDKIGITAGASTPPAIIKEAVETMNEEQNKTQTFEEMLDEALVTLHTGDVVKGTVISVSNGEVSVNLGYKSDGVITKAEYSDDPSVDPSELLKPGDEIQVLVIRVNDGDGNVLLSKKRLDAQKNYVEIEEACKSGGVLKGKVIEIVKGGLIALINGVRVFVPSSQISGRYVQDLNSFKGKEFDFNILEFDRSKKRIVAGRKTLAVKQEKERKEKLFSGLEIGSRIEGTVSRLVDFGAFVDLGGIDGLIHISEMSWGRVKKASDILKEGDKVEAIVLSADKAKGKISLSLKDVKENPWTGIDQKYPIGTVIEGTVVRLVPFGAFVELEEGVDGLIHISQISKKHVVRPDDVLSVGQVIKAKVTEIDVESKKISLSKKEVDADDPAEEDAEQTAETTEEVAKEE